MKRKIAKYAKLVAYNQTEVAGNVVIQLTFGTSLYISARHVLYAQPIHITQVTFKTPIFYTGAYAEIKTARSEHALALVATRYSSPDANEDPLLFRKRLINKLIIEPHAVYC